MSGISTGYSSNCCMFVAKVEQKAIGLKSRAQTPLNDGQTQPPFSQKVWGRSLYRGKCYDHRCLFASVIFFFGVY
ncbi:hypothetical protein CEXT_794181 [Caerostris extrusa]|uniref:Uncharacterized protein n=1 Tax=Caerostris extrusa TaxID=172846 RepID=A0AAV4SN86_CAEEX|nr:hypothetical protein CEXT_794181 [Caerostris extrusa]